MSQPKWKFTANIGDVNPLEHGGCFIYEDETGVYPPEIEHITVHGDDENEDKWEIHRTILEPCTYLYGVLSDNKFHPDKKAWFADKLGQVSSYIGTPLNEVIAALCGERTLVDRAMIWQAIGDYFGWANLDGYPLLITERAKVEARYTDGEVTK